jgi:hypothetical protein
VQLHYHLRGFPLCRVTLKQSVPTNSNVSKPVSLITAFRHLHRYGLIRMVYAIHCGHQRLLAYKALQNEGWIIPEIPIVYVEAKDKDEAKEKLLVATSSYGEFSASGVERYIQSLKNRDRIKKTINLSNVNLNRIYAVLNSHTDPEDVPVLTVKPTIAKQGDLWICGKHRIVCGDSREKSVIDRFGIDHFQLCLTDPPFGISYQPD